jgi:hypothetical protein
MLFPDDLRRSAGISDLTGISHAVYRILKRLLGWGQLSDAGRRFL